MNGVKVTFFTQVTQFLCVKSDSPLSKIMLLMSELSHKDRKLELRAEKYIIHI